MDGSRRREVRPKAFLLAFRKMHPPSALGHRRLVVFEVAPANAIPVRATGRGMAVPLRLAAGLLLALTTAVVLLPDARAAAVSVSDSGSQCLTHSVNDPGFGLYWAHGDCITEGPDQTCLEWHASDPTNPHVNMFPCLFW
jgi:hypothetical protein